MKKVEYTEAVLKQVDYLIEYQAIDNILNRYGKAKSILGGLIRDDYGSFASDIYAAIVEHTERLSKRFHAMASDEENLRERIRVVMEDMMRGRLYHVEGRSEEHGADLYIRVKNVEWENWNTLKVSGTGVDIDVNYQIVHVDGASCSFPIWDNSHRPHSLYKPADNYSGPIADWTPKKHEHFDNALPSLTEMESDQEVKDELLKRTFAI